MNLPFQALLLVLLVSPGVFFRYAYRKADPTRGTDSADTPLLGPTRETFFACIATAVVHGVLVHVLSWFGATIDLAMVTRLLLHDFGDGQASFGGVIAAARSHPREVFSYFAFAIAVGTMMGMAFGRLARWETLGLDVRFGLLEYSSPWTRVLRGETLQADDDGGRPVATAVTCALAIGGLEYLYTGILHKFLFDARGNLQRLVFTESFRRRLSEDLVGGADRVEILDDPRYYQIAGDYLVIEYSQVLNMDLEYIFEYPSDPSAGLHGSSDDASGAT